MDGYKGIKGTEIFPYVLQGQRDSSFPCIWGIMPQNMRKANRNMVGYLKSQGKSTDDAISEGYTKQDLNQFLATIAWVKNFTFVDESEPRQMIESKDELRKVFDETDADSLTELQRASRNIFMLRDGEKNASSSLSGAASNGSTQAGSDSTVSHA